jgi:hypothetical protein
MSFQVGQFVSLIGMAVPLAVVSIKGDDVTVREWDVGAKGWRHRTYKAATLRPTPPRRPLSPAF